jgi:spore coat protein U-like protein
MSYTFFNRPKPFLLKKKIKKRLLLTLKFLGIFYFLIFNLKFDDAKAVTSTANLTVSTSIAATCVASATPMSFGTYNSGAESVATSTLSINLTSGNTFRVTMADDVISPDTAGNYRLWLDGDSNSDYLTLSLYNPAGNKLHYSGLVDANNIIGSGTGSNVAVATITGRIPSGQTGKSAGNYNRTISLNIAY